MVSVTIAEVITDGNTFINWKRWPLDLHILHNFHSLKFLNLAIPVNLYEGRLLEKKSDK